MSECFMGEIRMFAGAYVPLHWAACNGASVAISQNQALFALISTTYGGNGVTNFNLPDYQGRTPIGQGQGTGLTSRVLGQNGGTETVTLVAANTPGHTHPFYASTVAATATTASGNMFAQNTSTTVKGPYTADTAGTIGQLYTTFIQSALGATGGGALPHANMMPFIVVNYIIATQGIFPSRN
ncbi:phage tail protein [Nitrospirillum viridazoti]|uniref:Phage tail protein n=1 Tax=Nitrospirillum viridazoti CBAmc TaxID=1441467 RepID=A0A248K350_9PROT|nr:tail fiber protein [Nitrospirillum amazonense]ASG25352.1 phage tail protein [Nitrospirillum amazonense CBAmc]TWB35443.1 microcystin-dependent protein [Nitrospirillum amazonense]